MSLWPVFHCKCASQAEGSLCACGGDGSSRRGQEATDASSPFRIPFPVDHAQSDCGWGTLGLWGEEDVHWQLLACSGAGGFWVCPVSPRTSNGPTQAWLSGAAQDRWEAGAPQC